MNKEQQEEIKKPIKVDYPEFNIEDPVEYQKELDKITDQYFINASTTRTLKNIREVLVNKLRKKYHLTNGQLKAAADIILRIHGLHEDNFDENLQFSKFISAKNNNELSIDGNANKTETGIKALMVESTLASRKLIGFDQLYRVMVDLYGREKAKELSGSMYDLSLAIADSTNLLIPYCYAADFSKLVTEERKFGKEPSAPAKRLSTYCNIVCDTTRELSCHLAGAVAISTFFQDSAHILIYKERIPLEKVKSNKKVRHYITNCYQQVIYSLNHASRDAVESPFTNVSCFDEYKLRTLISDMAWYFPMKIKALIDNNMDDEVLGHKMTEDEWKDFVVDYIMTLQEIYIDVFNEGNPLKGGLQFAFPVTTMNFSVQYNEKGGREIQEPNRLLNYVTKKDIKRYNIYVSEGTKVASCCRLINDTEMSELASSVNSFGGTSISLGSDRVVTIDLLRIAFECKDYEDYKRILKLRIDHCAKILKAHRVLIMKLKSLGTQPFISNYWINFGRMFGTYGCIGYFEADKVLKKRFNKDFDYMKDFMIYLNQEVDNKKKEVDENGNKIYNFPMNIEQIPGESMAVKIAKVDKILYPNEDIPTVLANQFVSLWEDKTIYEKMDRDGELNRLLTGGGICHIQCSEKLSSHQAKKLIKYAAKSGCDHFAINGVYMKCNDCNTVVESSGDTCPKCGGKHVEHYTRVIGFFSKVENWIPERQTADFPNRKFVDLKTIDAK